MSLILFLAETSLPLIENAFKEFTTRKDIAVILINQQVTLPMLVALDEKSNRWDRLQTSLDIW